MTIVLFASTLGCKAPLPLPRDLTHRLQERGGAARWRRAATDTSVVPTVSHKQHNLTGANLALRGKKSSVHAGLIPFRAMSP